MKYIKNFDTFESYKGPNQTWKTMDAYIKMHGDETRKREEERIHQYKEEEDEEEEDFVVDEFDSDTPDIDRPDIEEPSMRKNVSLGYGKTNMP